MMTKRLPHINNHHRPYKYQELRRKFKATSEHASSRGDEEYRSMLRSREKTNMATARSHTHLHAARSNTNLAVSKESLAASRDSLVIPEEEIPSHKRAEVERGAAHARIGALKQDLAARQTSLDQLSRRTVEGKQVYSFSLSKADRSKSDPVLFPPLSDRLKVAKPQQQTTDTTRNDDEHLRPTHAHAQATLPSQRRERESKNTNGIKFPIVSRYELYKHLGITSQARRKRTRRDAHDADAPQTSRTGAHNTSKVKTYVHLSQQRNSHMSPRIVADVSGRSRNASLAPSKDEQRKMDMYRKWHEQNGAQTQTKKLYDYETKEASRLASIYKERLQSSDEGRSRPGAAPPPSDRTQPRHLRRDPSLPKIGLKDPKSAARLIESALDGSVTNRSRKESQSGATNRRHDSPPAPIPEELLQRQYSARTWRTWRHYNESYAYNDVDRYIEENELMDDEKIFFIKQWIVEVNRHAPEVTSDDSDESDVDDDVTETKTVRESVPDNVSIRESVKTTKKQTPRK